MTNPDIPRAATVFDSDGNVVGTVRGPEGACYTEIQREGPNWFVPSALLKTISGVVRIDLTSERVRAIDLEKHHVTESLGEAE